MSNQKMRTTSNIVSELNESYADLLQAMKGTIKEAKATKQLSRGGNKSKLIKLGLALIVFPEPTPISEIIGTFLVAAGAVQTGIRNRAIYVEDVYKAFSNTLKEVGNVKDSV